MATKPTRTKADTPIDSTHPYGSLIWHANKGPRTRLMVGVPMTGLVRSEWMLARYGQVIPTNWTASEFIQWLNTAAPLNFAVAEARNLIIQAAVQQGIEWLLFIDSDTIIPPDTFIKMNTYIRDGRYPVVCGVYWTKSHPAEPLLYRGRGTSYATGWTMGEKVWVDGVPMGITLISGKLLAAMYADAPVYSLGGGLTVRKVMETPYGSYIDPETEVRVGTLTGTEDLAWCDRVIAGEYLTKAGFPAVAKRKYPFLADTSIGCLHIRPDGVTFPLGGLPKPGTKIT